jgi:hypothetical protein
MGKKSYTVEDVKTAVAESKSVAGVLRQLGLRPVGGNYKTIHRIIKENAFDTTHSFALSELSRPYRPL